MKTNKNKLKKDIKLLEKSIQLWEKHNLNQRSAKKMEIYADSCPLCKEYNNDVQVDLFACSECPLVLEGLDCGEDNSPWAKAYNLVEKWKKTGKKPKGLNKVVEEMIWNLKCIKWQYEEELKGKLKLDKKRIIRNIEKHLER